MQSNQYNPTLDVNALKDAIHNKNDDEMIKIFANRTSMQRQMIRAQYKDNFGKDLPEDIDDRFGGNFCRTLLAMMYSPWEYDARELRAAMKGIGTNDETLIEIISSRPSAHLKKVKEEFQRIFDRSLEKDIESDTSGDLKRLLTSLLQCSRSENPNPDRNQCMKDAQDLFNATEGWSNDESVYNQVFTQRSHNELMCISQCFQELNKKTLLEHVEKEFSWDTKKCLVAILKAMCYPREFFAERVYKAIKGWGTNDEMLIRVLVSRDEVDLPAIKETYQQVYGKSMLDDIIGDTSGDYKKLLVAIEAGTFMNKTTSN